MKDRRVGRGSKRKRGQGTTARGRGGSPGFQTARRIIRVPLIAFSLVAGVVLLPVGARGQTPPPDDRYSTIRTEHFRVTFPEAMSAVGLRASELAERAYSLLSEGFFPPPGTIDLLVADHVDVTGGFATPFPSNRVTIWAQPPLEGLALSQFDDWLDLVITHEVAHIFHFEHTGPPGRILRSWFGRVPERWPYYSVATVPFVAIEGVAVYQEFALGGSGRLQGTFQNAVVRAQRVGGTAETLDQGIGSSPVWPGGNRRYLFGSLFFEYLARSYGEESVVRFLRTAADQWVPFRLNAASRAAFGTSLDSLWEQWMDEVAGDVEELRIAIDGRGRGAPTPEILTEGGGFALYPAAGPAGVAYLRSDETSVVQIRLRSGDEDRELERWNTVFAPPRWGPEGWLWVPQPEYVDRYRIYRDLYRVGADGESVRVTRGLRVLHADPHPQGRGVAAVLTEGGATRLVVLARDGEIETVLREAEPGVHWSFPAWSPDGEWLAVVRRRPGGWSALQILDEAGDLVGQVVEDLSQHASPTWGPNGSTLLWSSDRDGVPNLYAATIPSTGEPPGPVLQVTDLLTAGTFPDVDPEGDWIYFSILDGDGWELGRIPYDPDDWFEPSPVLERFLDEIESPLEIPVDPSLLPDREIRRYSALRTLLPRYWLPIHVGDEGSFGVSVIPDRIGVRTSGYDLLQRHRYSFWVATSPAPPFGRSEWSAEYAWAGLGNPVVALESGQDWRATGQQVLAPGVPDPLQTAARERFVGGELQLARPRARYNALFSLGARWIREERFFLDEDGDESDALEFPVPVASLLEPHASLGVSTARAYPFSVSTEEGFSATVSYRRRRHVGLADGLVGEAGADGSLWDLSGSVQAYLGVPLFGYADHVAAIRIAGGTSGGPGAGPGHFGIGGAGRYFSVRGLSSGFLRFSRAWSFSAEWRFPIVIVNRGLGAWPFHLDRLAGSIFWDVAGGRSEGRGSGSAQSLGVEAVLTYSRWFDEMERVRVGVAFPTDSWAPAFHLGSTWSF